MNSEETLVRKFDRPAALVLNLWRCLVGEVWSTLLHFHQVKLSKRMTQVVNHGTSLLWIWVGFSGFKCRCWHSLFDRLFFVLRKNSLSLALCLLVDGLAGYHRWFLALSLVIDFIDSLKLRLLIRVIDDLHWILNDEATWNWLLGWD